MLDNPKHEAFANYILSEPSQAEAYRKAYPHAAKWKPESAQIAASRLAKNAKVALRIQELKQELKQELVKRTLWTRESSVKVLARIALKGERDSDKISSIKELNAMHGFNAPIAVDMSNKDGSLRAPTLDASKLSTSTLKELMGVIDDVSD